MRHIRRFLPIAVLCLLVGYGAWLYYSNLGAYAFRDWDESIYAQVARQSHDWLGFTWAGQASEPPQSFWFEKPPLIIWLIKISFAVFGVTEFAARIWGPLFALGTVILCYTWASTLWRSRTAGFLAASSLFFSFHFFFAAGLLTYDLPLTFFIALSLYGYARVHEGERWWLLFWLSIGCAVLTKNILGFLPLAIAAADLWLRETTMVFCRWFWVGVLSCVVLVVPWHLVETVRYGNTFWQSYLVHHVFSRFLSPIENNGQPIWYYMRIFATMPYGLLSIGALVYAFMSVLRRKWRGDAVLPLLAFIIIFCTFSFSRTKGDLYIVVVYPYLSLLIGLCTSWIFSRAPTVLIAYIATALFSATALVLAFQYNQTRLIRMKGPVYEDIKAIGLRLTKGKEGKQFYYISRLDTGNVLVARPELVFYTNRYVPEASVDLVRGLVPVWRTRTHVVFETPQAMYIMAVRFIP